MIVWICALLIGTGFFTTGIVYIFRKQGRREVHYALAAFLEFMSSWILYIPHEVYNDIPGSQPVLKWIESVFTALLKSFNVYSGNGYERAAYTDDAVFSSVYNLFRVLANIALLLFVGGFILKFLNGPLQRFKLIFYRKRYLYVMSACNEKTLILAKSILDKKEHKKTLVVFSCGDQSPEASQREQLDLMKALYVDCSVTDIIRKYSAKAEGMEIFLFEDKEENNLVLLRSVCTELEKTKNDGVKIYVELTETPWDMYDNYVERYGLGNRNIIINFVRVEEAFVYSELLKRSVFEKAAERENENVKDIRAIIVGGMNARNLEMLKALLHLCQMPGYYLDLTVIEDGHGRSMLRQLMPEVYDESDRVGDAVYKLNYIEGIDYCSEKFEQTLATECSDLTFAFINAGDDLTNVNLALKVKAIACRKGHETDKYTLLVNILNKGIWENWNKELCNGIVPVGCKEETYNYDFVTYSDIEQASEKIHIARHGSTKWISYLNNEYNRHSVFARTLSYKYKIRILGDRYSLAGRPSEIEWHTEEELIRNWESMSDEEKLWKAYEHMRWNMYTRTLGYRNDSNGTLKGLISENERLLFEIKEIKGQLSSETIDQDTKSKLKEKKEKLEKDKKEIWNKVKTIRNSAKIHNDLIPFDELSLTDKIKDNLELTEEVVDALKSI